jgi:hypothetical protein
MMTPSKDVVVGKEAILRPLFPKIKSRYPLILLTHTSIANIPC